MQREARKEVLVCGRDLLPHRHAGPVVVRGKRAIVGCAESRLSMMVNCQVNRERNSERLTDRYDSGSA